MLQDPAEERRRLVEVYRAKNDEELLILAQDLGDLTEIARQTLQDEINLRGIKDRAPEPRDVRSLAKAPQQARECDAGYSTIPPPLGEDEEPSNEPVDYSWKTQLCTCETAEQVWQLTEVLRRGGIDSWPAQSGGGIAAIFVAADQLDQARVIASQPIPSDILEASKEPVQALEFESPRCPACGAPDPALVAVDPDNEWECDTCGRVWTEAAPADPG